MNDNDQLQEQLKVDKHTKNDQRVVAKRHVRVMTGEMVMAGMQKIAAKVVAKKANTHREGHKKGYSKRKSSDN